MKPISPDILDPLRYDQDDREIRLRAIIDQRLNEQPPPNWPDHVVASYFFSFRTLQLSKAADHIAYHSTSGIKNPPPGSLLADCTAQTAGIDAWDHGQQIGLLHIAYPLKMMVQPDGHLTSCDLLHTTAGAIVFDVYENEDARLVGLQIPQSVLQTFPGPAYGPRGLRENNGFTLNEPAFGTILKPTAGITPEQVGALVAQAARCPLFLFVKEDENLYPNLEYSPVKERTRQAITAIEQAREHRGDRGLVFAPHITGSPHELLDTVHAVLEAGATGVMFSESFSGGAVRMVREATRHLQRPPAIYGHNAGIGVKTRCIWREVMDLLARLDGIDFRQTAPVRPGPPYIRPYGDEWRASEQALTGPISSGIRPTMIARAGGLDQGNIIMNLQDAERRGLEETVLFLAGSAINSIENRHGQADPAYGADAMLQALEIHQSGELEGVPVEQQLDILRQIAEQKQLAALRDALRQRYPGVVA